LKLRAGDLVTPSKLLESTATIFVYANKPGAEVFQHPIGELRQSDVALVISLSSSDAKLVYVIGKCSGWTFGAYLRKL